VIERSRKRAIVILKGFRCRWGRCVFCPFFLEAGNSLSDVIQTNDKILSLLEDATLRFSIERITVFNGGSFFELPLDTVLKLSRFTCGRIVDIESRPEYLSFDSVRQVLELLKPSRLVIRVGIEVWDEYLRNAVLCKGIPQSEIVRLNALREKCREVYGDEVSFIAYILFGIELIPESKVVESVEELSKYFDGIIAVQYRRVLDSLPSEAIPSRELILYLQQKCVDVDLKRSDESEWCFTGEVRYVIAD